MPFPFALTQRLKWAGRAPRPSGGRGTPATDREAALFAKYALGRFGLARAPLKEALGALDLLDRVPDAPPVDRPGKALDVGAKNWAYAPALSAWLERRGAVSCLGVELDAYRLYADLTTRLSQGLANAKLGSLSGVAMEYRAGDLLEAVVPQDGPFAIVTWLFPFVSEGPHRAWGLPRGRFRPEALFTRAASLLERGGLLVVANQGQWEVDLALPMLGATPGLKARGLERIEGSLHASAYPIFLSFWTREA